MVRVEILLSQGVEPRLERKDSQDLTLWCRARMMRRGKSAAVTGPAPAIVTPICGARSSETKTAELDIRSHTAGEACAERQPDRSERGRNRQAELSRDRLQNPDRLVLDFAGAHLKTSEKHIASNLDPVREIRLAQFSPEISRVVIDLRQARPTTSTRTEIR